MGPFSMVEVGGVEPPSKTCRLAAHPQAWSALEATRRGTDEPLGTLAPVISILLGGRGEDLSGASIRQAEATRQEV